jgi:tetratricopeptide (TPR) repeat protein
MDNSANNMSEKLVQYLDGELAAPEKEMIDRQLSVDTHLHDELESLTATREAVKMYGLQQKVSAIHGQMMKEMESPKTINPARRILRYGIAVAASVILIVGGIIGYNFYNLSSEKVFASNYHSYELGTVRDADTVKVSPIEMAYRDKDYRKAATLFSGYSDVPIKENFLAAMSYLELGNNPAAIGAFKKVIAGNERAKSNLFKDEAEYYLALTYIRNRDYDFAIDLFRSIKENPEHLYHEKATGKLIRQLKMLKWR